ncbi:MAG: archaeal proteasome endopeptidase complex subunit alpha [Candidatus Nanoarchaeia archaeon]|nr:archaeal proteasome endopeptidase complex subunit alpha [Candidatus Nanoarchaeia archaeon]
MQPQAQHQMMGYDRASTMFSPDGRLLQVEYAKKTVKQGSVAMGIVCKDGVILVADKRIADKLILPTSVEKVFQVDDHIAATPTGLVMDGRVLIERAQLIAQQHRVTYDDSIDVLTLVKEISDIKQAHTQYGGARPYGVSLLIAGINENPHLFMTDPTGVYFEYKATAIGEYEQEIKNILEKTYKDSITMDLGIKTAITSLKAVLGKEFAIERIDAIRISKATKKFERISTEELQKYNV